MSDEISDEIREEIRDEHLGRALDRLIRFYQTLAPDTLSGLAELYVPDAWFKDPFYEVQGTAAIERILHRVLTRVETPGILIINRLRDRQQAMLGWELSFRSGENLRVIRGVTHLKLDPEGRVERHRDYWDPAGELYAGLPLIGACIRRLTRRFSAL